MKRSSSRAYVRAWAHEAISLHSLGLKPVKSAEAHIKTIRSATLDSMLDGSPDWVPCTPRERAVAMHFPHDNQGQDATESRRRRPQCLGAQKTEPSSGTGRTLPK